MTDHESRVGRGGYKNPSHNTDQGYQKVFRISHWLASAKTPADQRVFYTTHAPMEMHLYITHTYV